MFTAPIVISAKCGTFLVIVVTLLFQYAATSPKAVYIHSVSRGRVVHSKHDVISKLLLAIPHRQIEVDLTALFSQSMVFFLNPANVHLLEVKTFERILPMASKRFTVPSIRF